MSASPTNLAEAVDSAIDTLSNTGKSNADVETAVNAGVAALDSDFDISESDKETVKEAATAATDALKSSSSEESSENEKNKESNMAFLMALLSIFSQYLKAQKDQSNVQQNQNTQPSWATIMVELAKRFLAAQNSSNMDNQTLVDKAFEHVMPKVDAKAEATVETKSEAAAGTKPDVTAEAKAEATAETKRESKENVSIMTDSKTGRTIKVSHDSSGTLTINDKYRMPGNYPQNKPLSLSMDSNGLNVNGQSVKVGKEGLTVDGQRVPEAGANTGTKSQSAAPAPAAGAQAAQARAEAAQAREAAAQAREAAAQARAEAARVAAQAREAAAQARAEAAQAAAQARAQAAQARAEAAQARAQTQSQSKGTSELGGVVSIEGNHVSSSGFSRNMNVTTRGDRTGANVVTMENTETGQKTELRRSPSGSVTINGHELPGNYPQDKPLTISPSPKGLIVNGQSVEVSDQGLVVEGKKVPEAPAKSEAKPTPAAEFNLDSGPDLASAPQPKNPVGDTSMITASAEMNVAKIDQAQADQKSMGSIPASSSNSKKDEEDKKSAPAFGSNS